MDSLNNVNTIVSVIVGLFGIGGYILGIVTYLRNKATSSQLKQTKLLTSSNQQLLHQTGFKPLSKLDWMEVLWKGLEDSVKAKDGGGWIASLAIGFIGVFILSDIIAKSKGNSAAIICFIVFVVLWFSANLLFYTYFVGRRVENKIENINKNRSQKLKMTQHP